MFLQHSKTKYNKIIKSTNNRILINSNTGNKFISTLSVQCKREIYFYSSKRIFINQMTS